jgi:hypothetical protein
VPSKICLGATIAAILIIGAAMTPSANAASPDDACSLLTQAQVSAAWRLGRCRFVPGSKDKKTCTWTVAGGAEYVTLMFEGLDAYQAGKVALTKTIVVTPVSGIGDEAYYLAVGKNIGKKGNVAFKVAAYGGVPIDKKEAMEKTLASQAVSKV